MTTILSRRQALAAALAGTSLLALGGRPVRAASRTLNVICHRVHQGVLTTGAAGDLIEPWQTANDVAIEWSTFDVNPGQDRLLREASLDHTDFGVGYIVDNRMTPDVAQLFEPLDGFQASEPIEAFDDIAPGLVAGMTIGGDLVAIPVRHATQGLFYNEELLAERGFSAPPATMEELVAMAKELTFTSSAGTQVTGMILASDLSVFPVMFARAFGGDFITRDFELLPEPAAMEEALAVLADMFATGTLPRSYATTTNDDQVTWLQQGRAALGVLPFSRHAQLNREDQSSYPGRIKAAEFPGSASLGRPMETVVESWAMAIPRSSADKDLSWSYIREVSSKAVTLGAAINGNGPVRLSTYAEPSFADTSPIAAVEAKALATARAPFPAFPEAVRAQATFLEEVQLAVLGRKSPKDAVAAIGERVTPLLPA